MNSQRVSDELNENNDERKLTLWIKFEFSFQ